MKVRILYDAVHDEYVPQYWFLIRWWRFRWSGFLLFSECFKSKEYAIDFLMARKEARKKASTVVYEGEI